MSCHHIEGVTCPACSSSRIEPVCLTCHPYPCTGHLTKMSIGVGADSHEIAALRVENERLRSLVERKRCPCQFEEIKPCVEHCACREPHMSRGCRRCAIHGSPEQQLATARFIVGREAEIAALKSKLAKWEKFETAGDVNKWIETLERGNAALKRRLEAAERVVDLNCSCSGDTVRVACDHLRAALKAYDALKEAKPSLRETAKACGIDVSQIKGQAEQIDILTGKRIAEEPNDEEAKP